MKVLVVEDDEDKRQHLMEFILSETTAEIAEARSLQGGLRALLRDSFDLVVLDMTMPTYDITPTEDGGRPQPYAGREILQQMERREIKTRVVIVTQFDRFGHSDDEITLEELNTQLKNAFPINYMGAVHYSVTFAGWQENLRRVLSKLNF